MKVTQFWLVDGETGQRRDVDTETLDAEQLDAARRLLRRLRAGRRSMEAGPLAPDVTVALADLDWWSAGDAIPGDLSARRVSRRHRRAPPDAP